MVAKRMQGVSCKGTRTWSGHRAGRRGVTAREMELTQVQCVLQAFGTAKAIAQPLFPVQTPPTLRDVSATLSSVSQSFTAISGSNTTALTTLSSFIILLLCIGH